LGDFRFDGKMPFIHNDFLFTSPQTLHVFKYRGEIKKMSAQDFFAFVGNDVVPAATPAVTAPLAPQAAPAPNGTQVPATNAAPADTNAAAATAAAITSPMGTSAVPQVPAVPAATTAPVAATISAETNAVSAPAPAPAPVLSTTGINPNDITDHVTFSYAAGGIFPQIVGTVLLVLGSMTIALTLGIFAAIYLSEYSRQGPIIDAIRLAIVNLAGVPSIVFGLFGVALFVHFFKWNISLLAGWFTLAFMVLPVIITASEESLRAVPKGFREGSLALGATHWQTIWQNVLPYALPGILTSSVLGIARVAGETAPILFTAAYATRDKLPWQLDVAANHDVHGFFGTILYPFWWVHDFVLNGVTALPYHIYVVSSKIPQNEYTERVQYGTAFVFLVVVMLIALSSVLLRIRLRSRLKW
jgi:phosphate transport system permease protein